MVFEALERKGFRDGVHYVVEKQPPTFTEKECADLPKWLKPYFWKPYNKIISYKRTIVFFTGLNITFGSLDRPASLAGRSYVHVFGDEVKYFAEAKIGNLLKARRGYRLQFGHSPCQRKVLPHAGRCRPPRISEQIQDREPLDGTLVQSSPP